MILFNPCNRRENPATYDQRSFPGELIYLSKIEKSSRAGKWAGTDGIVFCER